MVDYVTRMPDDFEAHVRLTSFGQDFKLYSTDERYTGIRKVPRSAIVTATGRGGSTTTASTATGSRSCFANKRSSSASGTGGTPVTGAILSKNPRNQDWYLLGATNQSQTIQDHAKARLSYDFADAVRATYTLGYWRNDATRSSESYLRDASRQTILWRARQPAERPDRDRRAFLHVDTDRPGAQSRRRWST